jgi:Flp pilus assembly protein TadD
LGRLEEAKQAYEHLLELAEKDESFQATAYGNLGIIYQIRGELDKAEEFYRKSLEIDKALGRQEGMASQYGNLGIIYKTRGELDKAEEFYRKSLDINKALGLQEGMAIQYGNLGVIYQTRGELDKACAYWQKSQELYLNIGAKPQSNMVGGWIIENCNIN